MTRLSIGTLLAGMMAGPWSGCDREPLTPPAAPPPERAPLLLEDVSPFGDVIFLDESRRRG